MSYLAESEIARVEWRVRQLHEKIRELGGDFSRRAPSSHLDAAISEQRHNLEKLRSTPAGQTASPAGPAEDNTAEMNKLRAEAADVKRGSGLAQSEAVKLTDELTALNTDKMRRLAQLERLEESIKARKIDLERDLVDEQEKLRNLKNRGHSDSSTVQIKLKLARKEKQLESKEKVWYGLSSVKQRGSLAGGERKNEEQALKSEVRGLKSEIRTLKDQLKKSDRVSEVVSGVRATGRVRRQLKMIAEIQKELTDIDKDKDREQKAHDLFIAGFHKREQEINRELARYQTEQQRYAREEQDWQRRQRELAERQKLQSSPASTAPLTAVESDRGQVTGVERKLKELEEQKHQAEDTKFQVGKMELDMKVLERDVQMLEGSIATAEPQVIAAWQARIRRMMNDFRQAKEDFQKLKE